MSAPRWWETPNLFDLVGGMFLDKALLARGVRSGSMRRVVVAVAAAVVFHRWMSDPTITWQHVAGLIVVVLGLDLQRAVLSAPAAALQMLGQVAGAARHGIQSGYGYASSVWSPTPATVPDQPVDTPDELPEAS